MFKKEELKTVSAESAQAQIDLFFDYYGYGSEDGFFKTQEDEDSKVFKRTIDRLKRAIVNGNLDISEDENGSIAITQITRKGSELVYPEPGAKNKDAMKSSNEFTRAHQLAGSMTGVGYDGICQMKGSDLSLCEAVVTLFLLV